jgi:hypothetical protein
MALELVELNISSDCGSLRGALLIIGMLRLPAGEVGVNIRSVESPNFFADLECR